MEGEPRGRSLDLDRPFQPAGFLLVEAPNPPEALPLSDAYLLGQGGPQRSIIIAVTSW